MLSLRTSDRVLAGLGATNKGQTNASRFDSLAQTGSHTTNFITHEKWHRFLFLLLTIGMFGLLPETAADGFDSLADFLIDSDDDFNSPSGRSGIRSSAPNESEGKPEQAINYDRWHDDVLDMDDSDIDGVSRLDGECEDSSMETTQIRISEVLSEDIIPHTPPSGQPTKLAGCVDIFFDAYIYIY